MNGIPLAWRRLAVAVQVGQDWNGWVTWIQMTFRSPRSRARNISTVW